MKISETAKEKYLHESVLQVAPIDGSEPYHSQAQTRKKGCKEDKQARIAELNWKWNQTKASMASKAQDLTTKKKIIRGMAETCTELLHVKEVEWETWPSASEALLRHLRCPSIWSSATLGT